MSAQSALEQAPLFAAPSSTEYSGSFVASAFPSCADALSAWVGTIRPFPDDETARSFMRAAEADEPIWIHAGRVQQSIPQGSHWADPYLVNMARDCTVLTLVMAPPAHPRAYLVNPRVPNHYIHVHPHPRSDQMIEFDGLPTPGLCIYSAAEFKYDPDRDRTSQFLDQLTIFVGKHLIWLRTRQFYEGTPTFGVLANGKSIGWRGPDQPIIDDRPQLVMPGPKPIYRFWAGHWPGSPAIGRDPESHVKTIPPGCQCWCGSGIPYGACHRPMDLKLAEQRRGQRRPYNHAGSTGLPDSPNTRRSHE
jgi:SEC-C motif